MQIKITNFDLTYDGMYFINWDNRSYRVFLELNTILKMLECEGLSHADVDELIKKWKPIHFDKVTMIVNGEEKGGELFLKTSDMSDGYLGESDLTMVDIEVQNI